MRNLTKQVRATTRKLVTLAGLTALTFAAGIDWAHATENTAAAASAMPEGLQVAFVFVVTLCGLIVMATRPREGARVRGRAVRRRTPRR